LLFVVVLIGCLCAFFASLMEFNDQVFLKTTKLYPVYNQIPLIFFAQFLFILVYNFQHYFVFLLIGVFFILVGFYYLGIITFSNIKIHRHFTIQTMLISVVSAISGLIWQEAIWGVISFAFSFSLFYTILKKGKNYFLKNRKNVNELLELFQIVNGIFIFVIGLIIASDRIRILKKIVNWFFT
jgi:hypothetical protein